MVMFSYYVSVVDSIHKQGGHVKTWIQNNVRRIQDGMIGLFSGFIITNQDIGLAMTMIIVASFLAVVAYVIGIK
tara:strand:+ start:246 stop:467 length:222 start_codon:yes stop_codon:yes gene_type:complete